MTTGEEGGITVSPAPEPIQIEIEPIQIWGNGLYYVHRNGQNCTQLDHDLFDGRDLPRPERDVAIALLKYSLGKLELADEAFDD